MSLKREAVIVDLTDDSPEPKKNKKTVPEVIVSLVSYNIWFDPVHQTQRMQALQEAILNTSGPLPRFIGLQEVTASLAATLFPLLESNAYQIISQPSAAYGCALALLQVDEVVDSGFRPFHDSIMGRGILWAHARVEGQSILFTTAHLESYVKNYNGATYTGAPQRESQLREMKKFCEGFLGKVDLAIITGDLNWDDERKTKSAGADKPMMDVLGDEWVDAWRVHRPNEEGYTYDAKESAMLRGNLRRRFDRCLIRSNSRVSVQDTELIGTRKIANLLWEKEPHPMAKNRSVVQLPVLPSDHFGLRVTLQLNVGRQ